MEIKNIHKSAILKLINSLTTTNPVSSLNNNNNNNNNNNDILMKNNFNENNLSHHQDMPNIQLRFDEPQTIIDLSVLTRLGYIISKFEQYFRPNSLIINGDFSKSVNNQNLFYLQQITLLIQSIENNNLLKVKLENDIEQQSLQHVQMLVLLIRDWMSQFYLNKSFIHELFPSTTTNDGTTLFSLMEIKENNIIIISLLIFNIFYRLRNSFTEYSLLLEFSWICFTELEPFINLANFDQEYIYNMLQSSLLTAHIEEEQEQQINSSLYKQIDMLNNKIVESKKRMLSLDVTTVNKQLQGSTNYNKSSSTAMKNIHSDLLTSKSSLKINQSSSMAENHRPTGSSSTLVNLYSGSKVFQHQQQSMDQQQQRDDKSNDMKRIERPYKCDVCMKTFPTSYKLNRHSYSHSGERPYMCTWPNCDKRFNDNYHLRRHMNTHTGEKPYPCKYPDCPKRYSRSEDLRNHQKTHCIITTQQLIQSQQQQQQQQQQQSMNLVQNQQHQQSSVSSSLLLQQQQQQPPSSNTSNNIVQQLVRQQQAGISMAHQPSSPVAKSPAASTTGHQHQQQHQHHRMAPQQLQQSTDVQLLNQLQQHMQQNYSSSVNLPQQQQEHHLVSSPPNQGTNPQQQQNQTAASMQQHLTENYF